MVHTHDGIDWAKRVAVMRRTDAIEAEVNGWVARRLVDSLPAGATVVDVGSGTGGMAVALAAALAARGGGRVVLVDAVPELQAVAVEQVRAVDKVEVVAVRADAAEPRLAEFVPAADLVWASRIVHHLPDQLAGLAGLARLLRPGGQLALSEGGLHTHCLPWDLGIGEPGLQDRLVAARNAWFADMRAAIDGAVRLPIGWNRALTDVGLRDVTAFSYLVDLPAPATEQVRESVADWLAWLAAVGADRLPESDRDILERLLTRDGPDWVAARDDVFVLNASTVHLGHAA